MLDVLPENNVAKVAAVIAGFIVLLFLREYIYVDGQYYFDRKSRNCGSVKTMQNFPLGFKAFYKMYKAQRQNRLLQFNSEAIQNMGRNTVRSKINLGTNIITVDPENVKTILATSFKDYSLGLRYNQFFPLLGNGIFTLSGEGWKHSRALLRPQFSRDQISQLDTVHTHTTALLQIFIAKSAQSAPFDCQALFHNLTLDTATEFLFGESTDSLYDILAKVRGEASRQKFAGKVSSQQFAESFNDCLEILSLRAQASSLYWLIHPPRLATHADRCKEFVNYFVDRTLSRPIEEKSSDDKQQKYVFIEELAKETRDPVVIRDQSFNILLAGRDTTASLLSYITFFLARDKRVWNKLREIVIEEFGRGPDPTIETDTPEALTFESLKRCTYLNHVINEVLRLNPIVPLNFRTAIRDTVLPRGGGPNEDEPVFVPKDTPVFYSTYTMQRLKSVWGEDANSFRPERWEEGKARNWEYLPFNGGPRICLGQQFALTETAFTLVRILQTFRDIEPMDQLGLTASQVGDVDNWTKLTSSVANGVHVKFIQ